MKTLTTMTAIAALIVGVSFANAQTNKNATPSSGMNAAQPDSQSGSTKGTAINTESNNDQKAAGKTASDKKMKSSTTGMKASDSKANANVSPNNPNSKMPDTNSTTSGSEPKAK
ncbi:MAG TPA: hypothetical protein VFC54_09960 [Pseudolabrys sp.]|nr:hypothetical protein [Pseudolabrys sp.]